MSAGHCILGNNLTSGGYLFFTPLNLAIFVDSTVAPQPAASSIGLIDLGLLKLLPFSAGASLLKLDSMGEGPVASVPNVGNTGKDCKYVLGQKFSDFDSTCVEPFAAGDPNNTINKNKLFGAMAHSDESYEFDIQGVDPQFAASSQPDNKVIADGQRPGPDDLSYEFRLDQYAIGRIANDYANNDVTMAKDWHGNGMITLEWANLVQQYLTVAYHVNTQLGDADCIADPVHPATAGKVCSGIEGIVTTAPPALVPATMAANALAAQATMVDSVDGTTPGTLAVGMKPGTWYSIFQIASVPPYGYIGGNFGYNGQQAYFFDTMQSAVALAFGGGNNVPLELQSRRFYFKEWILAVIKYLQSADNPAATLAMIDANPADPDNLFFDSDGGGFENAEYVFRSTVNSAMQPPTALDITTNLTTSVINDFEFTRYNFRGEKALYAALKTSPTDQPGATSLFLSNIVGSPVLQSVYPGGYACAINTDPAATACVAPGLDPKATPAVLGPVDAFGKPLYTGYAPAFGASVLNIAANGYAATPSAMTVESSDFTLIQSAMVTLPIWSNPYDPNSATPTDKTVSVLVPYLPKGADVGFPVTIDGSRDKFYNTFNVDLTGTTVDGNVDYEYVPGQGPNGMPVNNLIVRAFETQNYLGYVFVCAEPSVDPALAAIGGKDLLAVRMYQNGAGHSLVAGRASVGDRRLRHPDQVQHLRELPGLHLVAHQRRPTRSQSRLRRLRRIRRNSVRPQRRRQPGSMTKYSESFQAMKTFKIGTALAGAILVFGAATGCVADRPSRNGVFNENQYLRKDFLIQSTDANGSGAGQDSGWLMRTTVTETSTPNLLGSNIGVWGGENAEVKLVRFRVTQDKLQMLDQVQYSTPANPDPTTGAPGAPNTISTTDTIINAWPSTNVDLKYRVNLDGEKTNFYEENQELDWQVRQWVKLNFAKNDFSDLAPLGIYTNDLINKCGDVVDASATLVTGSFNVESAPDPKDDYFEFTVQVAIPMIFVDPSTDSTAGTMTYDTTCQTAYGPMAANALKIGGGRSTVTVNLKYSFKRATPAAELTYKPWILDEKDPIHRKYGPFLSTVFNRDPQSGLIAANQFVGRFDPAKPIVWYFDKNFPAYYKPIFLGTGGNPGIMQKTNDLLTASGAPARVQFLDYNDGGIERSYGDVRYNFFRWASDQDLQDSFAGVTMPGFDPRTGEIINESIEFNDFAVKDYYVQRIDAFLKSVGASAGLANASGWMTGACDATKTPTQPIVTATVTGAHNASSTLYTKMQQYLGLQGPTALGPQDFTAVQDADFFRSYFALAPYEVFADPDMNLFVTREGGQGVYGPAAVWQTLHGEGEFQRLTALINSGVEPYQAADGTAGVLAAAAFANQMRDATNAHQSWQLMKSIIRPNLHMDVPGAFSLETVMEQDSQQCIGGMWETQDHWVQHIIDTYWQQVFWHEFGHAMGLEHNFMANIDMPNFTTQRDASGKALTDANGNTLYNMYSSSVMEYNAAPARLAWTQGWGNYDKGAIAWIYANNGRKTDDPAKDAMATAAKSISGEIAGAAAGQEYPYADPLGFCAANDSDCTAGAERLFLRCDESHLKYSPMCRQGDLGVTPSQIVANSIDNYEWQYQWRNFRDYRKVWDASSYANEVAGYIVDQRRFLSQWAFDWSPGELATTLYRIGITPPANAPSAVDYYGQLTQKFHVEMSKANQMVSAFSEAVIQQAAGERPYATIYDKFYGDVTQQGIILDKYFAMQNFVGLWNSDNYDQNQAGAYISTWGGFDFDSSFQSIAETAITSMIGSQYAVYPYFIPTAVALFAQDTHNPAFLGGGGRTEAKDWIGGWVFTREQDLIDYFKNIAVTSGGPPAATGLPQCTAFATCAYDVTDGSQVQQDPVTGNFVGPDGLTYAYAYIPSRHNWVLARADRNIATYKNIINFNTDLFGTKDDGSNGTYSLEYQIKYTIDSYNTYESP